MQNPGRRSRRTGPTLGLIVVYDGDRRSRWHAARFLLACRERAGEQSTPYQPSHALERLGIIPSVTPVLSIGSWFQCVGHADQVGERPGAHLAHCRSAMDLDRYLTQAQVTSHLFIHLSGRHQHHDLLLARR